MAKNSDINAVCGILLIINLLYRTKIFMKKTFIALTLVASMAGCSDLKDRLDKVEDGVSQLENKVSDLEGRLNNIESGVYITSVTEIKDENGNVTGMTFTLSEGEPIVILFSDGIKVEPSDTEVKFILTDGSAVVIPIAPQTEKFSFKINTEGNIAVLHGQSVTVNYSVSGTEEEIELYFAPDAGWSAEKYGESAIKITAPESGPLDGRVTVFAGNSSNAAIAVISFEEGRAVFNDNTFDVGREAGQLNVPVSTNVSYEVSIPQDCGWLSYVETKAMRNETLVFNVAANTGYKRSAEVVLKSGDKELCSFKVNQDGETPSISASSLVGNWTVNYTNQANTPLSFTMPIVESDNPDRGNLILKRWFNYSKKDKAETIYATFSPSDMTLSIATTETVQNEYGDQCAARLKDGSVMSPIVFTVSSDCRTISIDPSVSIGTYDPIYGAGFTNYGSGYSLTKE